MTYGEYQEAASDALSLLLQSAPPASEQELVWALASREQILMSLAERLQLLSVADLTRADTNPRRYSHESVVARPLAQLARVMQDFERAPCDFAPSDVLDPRSAHSDESRRLWQEAARSMFLATTELGRSEQLSLAARSRIAWPVVADMADVVEALVLLDARLGLAGPGPRGGRDTAVAILVASNVGKIARLRGGDRSIDTATASPMSSADFEGTGVTFVRTQSDVVAAERHLAAMLHTWRPYRDPATPEERPGLRVARVVATGHVRLGLMGAQLSLERGDRVLASSFMAQVNAFRRLHATSLRMVDTLPRRSTLALVQQAEISTRSRQLGLGALSSRQLAEVCAAAQGVGTELGKSLRGDIIAAPRIQELVGEDNSYARPRPVSSRQHPFYVACVELANLPLIDQERFRPQTNARVRLRQSLDRAQWPSRTRYVPIPTASQSTGA